VSNEFSTADTPRPLPRNSAQQQQSDLIADLPGAVGRGEFVAYFQPQLELATGKITAAEALCRWLHPTLGIVTPSVFIPLAEQSDEIQNIGAFMLDASSEFLRQLAGLNYSIAVSVNVSPEELKSSRVFEHLRNLINDGDLDPQLLTLEVTESVEIQDMDAAAARLTAIRNLGVGISVDDFGVGHSSAIRVTGMPVTEIKIDRSLVQGHSGRDKALFNEAMHLARGHNLRVVAEGVETEEQKEYAASAGCHRAQGYLFGHAMRFDEFASFLARYH
jgi:EAL domain-containing protein (putative c-di-GMP-specific phosphodiesterase class I)